MFVARSRGPLGLFRRKSTSYALSWPVVLLINATLGNTQAHTLFSRPTTPKAASSGRTDAPLVAFFDTMGILVEVLG